MASEPMTEAGKRLLEAHGDAAVYCGMGDENLTPLILAIEAEAADLPRRWPKGPTDRDGNPLPATPAETGLLPDELRALSDAASEGPWRGGTNAATMDGIWSDTATGYDREEGEQVYLVAWCHGDWRADEDAAFIVAAVNYLRTALSKEERP